MGYLGDLAFGDRVLLYLYRIVHPADTKTTKVCLLTLGLAVAAYNLCNSILCHNRVLQLTVENFAHRNSAKTGYRIGIPHLRQSGDRRLHKVVGVGRTLAFGEDVLDAGRLEDGTHSTARLDTRSGGGGFHKHAGTTEFSFLLVRDRGVDDRDLDKILLGILDTLGDSRSDLVSLTKTITDNSVFVSYDHDSCKAEMTAALGHFGDSLDGYQSVLELKVRSLYFLNICICHSLNY